MVSITFEQFINTFNFREVVEYAEPPYSTKIIRFYLGDDCNKWFEFGVNDFTGKTSEIISESLSKRVLDSVVTSITYDEDMGKVMVRLSELGMQGQTIEE